MSVLTLSSPRRALRIGVALAMFWGLVAPLRAETPVSKEYQVKAVFLFNFAQFVQWPHSSFGRPGQPFRIGILGDDPFDGFLDKTVEGERVDGHPLVIRRYDRVESAKECQILFISRSEAGRLASILESLKGNRILTVGDTESFIQDGGMVRFFIKGNNIRFKINPEAAKRADLIISSQVLRLAEIAEPGEN